MVEVKCSKCGNVWNYKGTKTILVTCTNCYKKVRIPKQRIRPKEESVEPVKPIVVNERDRPFDYNTGEEEEFKLEE